MVTCLLAASLSPAHISYAAESQPPAPAASAANSYFVSAQKALTAGDLPTAAEKLRQAVQADPKFAPAYLLLGLTEFRLGDMARAIENYKRALELQPRSFSGHYNLALAYLRGHRLEEGRSQLEQAVKLDPGQADAAYDLGIVLLELRQPVAALPHLIRARRLNPRRPDVAFNIVRAELEAGRVAEARAEAQATAKRLSADFQWNAALGQLFLKNAQPRDAATYFRAASLVRPGDIEIRHQLGLAYLASGQASQVLDLIAEPKTADDHYLRGSAFYLDHRFSDADQESEQALALAPDNPQVLVLRTRLLQRAGLQDAAVELAQKAMAQAPQWDEPYYLAGVSLYFIRRYAEAEQNLARAAELNPSSARTLFLKAVALVSQGKHAEAEQCFRRAIALDPNNARFRCHLGIFLMRQNEYPEAEESFRKAIELKPAYGLSHYELGVLLTHSERWKEAAEELSEAVTRDPTLAPAYYQLGRVYSRLGEAEKSKLMFAEFKKLSQQQENDDARAADQARDEDTRKETEF
ncbi:MAG: tetratricopeptide repeat protein [Terriglobales bacterium]